MIFGNQKSITKILEEQRSSNTGKWQDLLKRKQAGEDILDELEDFLRNKEEVFLFFSALMTSPERLAAVLDAVEAQLDLLTDLTLILADQVNPTLTTAQQAAVQEIQEQLVPLRAIDLSQVTQNYRFANLLLQKQQTRNMQQEYFNLKNSKKE